jgi:hypothetical protein
MTPSELWTRYAGIWSADATTRAREIGACLADEATYCDPNVALSGAPALSDYMASFQAAMPGCAFRIDSVWHHHDRSLAAWTLVDPSGREVHGGLSGARLSADGRFADIAGFFMPAGEAAA